MSAYITRKNYMHVNELPIVVNDFNIDAVMP